MQNDSPQIQKKTRTGFWFLVCITLFLAIKLTVFAVSSRLNYDLTDTSILSPEQVLFLSIIKGIYLGFAASVFNGLIGLIALTWTNKKSNAFFFGTFFSWMFFKLVVLSAVAFYVYSRSQYHIVASLLSLVGFTFILTLTTIKTVSHSNRTANN